MIILDNVGDYPPTGRWSEHALVPLMSVKLLPIELALPVRLRHIRQRTAGTRADGIRRLELPRHRCNGLVRVADAVWLETLDGTLVVGTFEGEGRGRDLVALLDILMGVFFTELSDNTTVEVQEGMDLVFASNAGGLSRCGLCEGRASGFFSFVLIIGLFPEIEECV